MSGIRFLYVGTDDVDADVDWYRQTLGATLRWRFRAFSTDVAGVELPAPAGEGEGPLVLLAEHRPAGSVLPIVAVADLDAALQACRAAGGTVGERVGTPEGETGIVTTPGGIELGILEVTRPGAMDGAYADLSNPRAVH